MIIEFRPIFFVLLCSPDPFDPYYDYCSTMKLLKSYFPLTEDLCINGECFNGSGNERFNGSGNCSVSDFEREFFSKLER